jgi:DNA topoisomerase-1
MKYQLVERNERHVDAIAKALKKAKSLHLATDPDREGEAIAWHLYEILKLRGELKHKDVHRVVFHEITKNAVREAVAAPRDLSLDLVNAQQARRALDYLVGFNLSPLLWKKVRRGLSAGRVQSPALRMICEREAEIAAFEPREYWTIDAVGEHSEQSFPLKLIEFRGNKVEQFSFTDEARHATPNRASRPPPVRPPRSRCWRSIASSGAAIRRRRSPPRRCSRRPRASSASPRSAPCASRSSCMKASISGKAAVGLITYMRTDSVSLAAEAVQEIRRSSRALWPGGLAEEVRVYKTKSKNAQEAHEAIRPTSAAIVPADIERAWRRISSSCTRSSGSVRSPARWRTRCSTPSRSTSWPAPPVRRPMLRSGTCCAPTARRWSSRATSRSTRKARDDANDEDNDHVLPPMDEGDGQAAEVQPQQHFTEPPPRFTEASLVKALEEYGIGRPSTYASIISTLRDREYVDDREPALHRDRHRQDRQPLPDEHFHQYVDYGFTAAMEDELDAWRAARKSGPRRCRSSGSRSYARSTRREECHARAGSAGARARHRSRQRQADERAHGPLRPVRADRHQGR